MAAPDFFTVEEAARILRIGRTAAYQAAKRYRQTNGADGLPCIAIRGSLRVPRHLLEAMAGGPIGGNGAAVTKLDDRPRVSTERTTTSKRTTTRTPQPSLPFTG